MSLQGRLSDLVSAIGADIKNLGLTRNKTYATTIGDGSSTSISVTHNIGTKDVTVQIRDLVNDRQVWTTIDHTSVNVVTLSFATAPASNAYRVVIQGRPD